MILFRLVLLFATVVFGSSSTFALPDVLDDVGREQRRNYTPAENDLMRIWMVHVDQADGIIIQFPPKYNYEIGDHSERLDVIVDTGKNETQLKKFWKELYGSGRTVAEHVVITHHDSDHVAGLKGLIKDNRIRVDSVYHNGLATYKPDKRGFRPTLGDHFNAVYKFDKKKKKVTRGMAFLRKDSNLMRHKYLIDDLDDLRQGVQNDDFGSVYGPVADAIFPDPDKRAKVRQFSRVWDDSPFIEEREQELRGRELEGVSFDLLWPQRTPRKFANSLSKMWGETVNGNSVTFRLDYGSFEMLFTGDHNELSEEALLRQLSRTDQLDALNCDVLKIPHHGSAHALQDFFEHAELDPVVAVASMGNKGLMGWSHPSYKVIDWLGGNHRVFHTYVDEGESARNTLFKNQKKNPPSNPPKLKNIVEKSHILIETDGKWFRIVELPLNHGDMNDPLSVSDTNKGDGTRWIKAK